MLSIDIATPDHHPTERYPQSTDRFKLDFFSEPATPDRDRGSDEYFNLGNDNSVYHRDANRHYDALHTSSLRILGYDNGRRSRILHSIRRGAADTSTSRALRSFDIEYQWSRHLSSRYVRSRTSVVSLFFSRSTGDIESGPYSHQLRDGFRRDESI